MYVICMRNFMRHIEKELGVEVRGVKMGSVS